jgi:hypothetical protein
MNSDCPALGLPRPLRPGREGKAWSLQVQDAHMAGILGGRPADVTPCDRSAGPALARLADASDHTFLSPSFPLRAFPWEVHTGNGRGLPEEGVPDE